MESRRGKKYIKTLVSVAVLVLLAVTTGWATKQVGAACGTDDSVGLSLQSSSGSATQEKAKESEDRYKGLRTVVTAAPIKLRGVAKTADGKPIAGAVVGLLVLGSETATKENILSWGRTDPEGKFILNNAVRAGEYTLKVSAIGYDSYTKDIKIKGEKEELEIELQERRKE